MLRQGTSGWALANPACRSTICAAASPIKQVRNTLSKFSTGRIAAAKPIRPPLWVPFAQMSQCAAPLRHGPELRLTKFLR
jgi:hypothetical protein